jgi:hypothetical protein
MESTPTEQRGPGESRDANNWAPLVDKLKVTTPGGATNLVQGRRLQGPLQGFGKMWQKTYRIKLDEAAEPAEVIRVWKDEFPSFWPRGNRFYPPLTGIEPGEVALISVSAGPMRLSTGVMVLYADDESFTLMTPQGHMFAGWITFSAFEEDGRTVAQTQVLMRAQDPISEIGLKLGGHKQEDAFWQHTLAALAAHFGVDAAPETNVACIDPRCNWGHAMNVWHNAGIRSVLHTVTAPGRWLSRPFRRPVA